ncbi:MAG: radical SAM protein [Candidatus Hermodarchaeota archaeon]
MKDGNSLCNMIKQGYQKGACETTLKDNLKKPACQATLRYIKNQYHRVISAMHLSRPEDYFSIYQSGCNHNCLKCHSWEFSKHFNGKWYSTDDIAENCKKYAEYITVLEPRERALMYYANDLCKHCGSCIIFNKRSPLCPNKVSRDKIVFGPQGFGPARNIVAFTGGDIACQANFYAEATKKIKDRCDNLHVLLETNGFGLTPKNLDLLQKAGLDSFWLDIKAFDEDKYRRLCGTSNKTVLNSPKEIIRRNFVLEILTVYIPNFIEMDQFEKIAQLIMEIDENIPFHILAFFPQYKLHLYRSPNLDEIIETFKTVKEIGLKEIQLGNIGVFAKTDEEIKKLIKIVGKDAI